jgi:hypothetical protein
LNPARCSRLISKSNLKANWWIMKKRNAILLRLTFRLCQCGFWSLQSSFSVRRQSIFQKRDEWTWTTDLSANLLPGIFFRHVASQNAANSMRHRRGFSSTLKLREFMRENVSRGCSYSPRSEIHLRKRHRHTFETEIRILPEKTR